jgi:hypothetical protein
MAAPKIIARTTVLHARSVAGRRREPVQSSSGTPQAGVRSDQLAAVLQGRMVVADFR